MGTTGMSAQSVLAIAYVDKFRSLLRPINGSMTIAGRGEFTAAYTRIDLRHVWMQRIRESLPRIWDIEMRGLRRSGLSFAVAGESPIVWRGAEISAGQIALRRVSSRRLQSTTGFESLVDLPASAVRRSVSYRLLH